MEVLVIYWLILYQFYHVIPPLYLLSTCFFPLASALGHGLGWSPCRCGQVEAPADVEDVEVEVEAAGVRNSPKLWPFNGITLW